jgi:hypothetical protein
MVVSMLSDQHITRTYHFHHATALGTHAASATGTEIDSVIHLCHWMLVS